MDSMDDNAFGKLVRVYRLQRGWKQAELADRWGVTREYVSQVERGKRKLEKYERVTRLADILGIPEEKLAAVKKGLPTRTSLLQTPLQDNDQLLQAFLEPAQNTVKMSYLLWKGDGQMINPESSLNDLKRQLESALQSYKGQFRKPALRMLALTQEMLGKLAVDRTNTQLAISHFQAMYDIAEEIADDDLQTLALIHQSEMFRRRGWYEASFKRMAAAETYVRKHEVSRYIQGVMWKASAINYFTYGNEQNFLYAIDHASAIAEDSAITIDALSNDFDKIEVLQVKAQGYTMLQQPEKALEIYKQTDRLRLFRPLREQASYYIIKAQAHCHAGDTKTGIRYAKAGMKIAESFRAPRYIIRLMQMSDRLQSTPLGKEQAVMALREEILSSLQRLKD